MELCWEQKETGDLFPGTMILIFHEQRGFNRFREVVEEEIPPELYFNCVEKSKDYAFIIGCLGFHEVSLDENRLSRYHEFPFLVSIDIA